MSDDQPSAEIDHTPLNESELQQLADALYGRGRATGRYLRGPVRETVERIVKRRDQHHLDMHRAYRPEVVAEVAVHLGSHEDWEELTKWTGGRIETSQDPSGEYTSTLVLPNGEAGGDWAWVVLNHAGEFHIRAEVAAPEPLSRPDASTEGGAS